jgi:hypothetical protein
MPLPLETQKAIVTPNAIYAPLVQIMCVPSDVGLHISANITLSAAEVKNAGEANESWIPSGRSELIIIPDILNLEPDIIAAAPSVGQLFLNIVQLIGYINNVRKVL